MLKLYPWHYQTSIGKFVIVISVIVLYLVLQKTVKFYYIKTT